MSVNTEIIRNCFQDIISIRGGCGDIASVSGLYANQIDITPDFINEIINRTYLSPTHFFQEKLNFAIENVINSAVTFLSPKFRAASLLNDYRVGQPNENLKLIAGDGKLKGINIDMCNSDSYLNLFVNEISLQVDFTGDVNVLVYDLIQNKLLDTITIAAVANEIIAVHPAKEYFSSKKKLNLLFVYDSTGISSNTTTITDANCSGCGSRGMGIKNSFEYVNGASIAIGAQKIKSNLTLSNETGGMSIVHSISCNQRQWLCSYSNLLAMPILYKFGELVMDFAMTVSPNDRVNTTTFLNVEELGKRRNYYISKFNETFNNVLSNIEVPDDYRCYKCREGIVHQISHL